jgi:hypothetical protein
VCHGQFTMMLCLEKWSDEEVHAVIQFLWVEDFRAAEILSSGRTVCTTNDKCP